MKFEIVWKDSIQPVGPTYYKGYVGKWYIFTITKSMMQGEEYKLHTYLPGIKQTFSCASVERCKHHSDGILKTWIEGLIK